MSWLSNDEVRQAVSVAHFRYLIEVTPEQVREVEHATRSGGLNQDGLYGVAVARSIEIVQGFGVICASCAISGTCAHTAAGRARRQRKPIPYIPKAG
jgi:hypothetical protein